MEFEKEIQRFREEFLTNGGDMDGCLSLRGMENIADRIRQVEDFSASETCPDGYVPLTQFLCFREPDRKVVGVIQVRHYLKGFLETYGGHIGYSVCFSERRKGIATFMLSKMLPLCREMGMEKILVTCLKENEGSRRVIKNNGGIYEDTLYEPSRGVFIERYRIDLSKKIP